jgi:hypothetical protein
VAEQIEVARVEMVGEKALAIAPRMPSTAEALEAALVEAGRSLPALDALQHARVGDRQHRESDRRCRQPPRRDRRAQEREPDDERDDRRSAKARVREDEVTPVEIREPLAPAFQPLSILRVRLFHDARRRRLIHHRGAR